MPSPEQQESWALRQAASLGSLGDHDHRASGLVRLLALLQAILTNDQEKLNAYRHRNPNDIQDATARATDVSIYFSQQGASYSSSAALGQGAGVGAAALPPSAASAPFSVARLTPTRPDGVGR